MLVLDTSVLAALMQSEPDPTLVRWLDAQPRASVWTTTLTVAELEAHLEQVGDRDRRRRLQDAFDAVLVDDLSGRVLAFDRAAATASAGLSAREHRAGRRLETRDALIAGIVLARKGTLATADAERFERLGIRSLDPWRAAATT